MDTERWEQRHRERMERRRERWARRGICGGTNPATGMFIGLGIVALGVLFLLRNVGILYFDNIWQFWPVILIAIGISKVANMRSASCVTTGLIMGGIGIIFLLRNLGYIYGDIWQYLWPGILIAVGVSILVKHLEWRDRAQDPSQDSVPPGPASQFPPGSGFTSMTSGSNTLHAEVVFSSTRQRIDSQNFEGGKVSALFGGAEIDLRSAGTKLEEVTIKAEAVFSGIELWVPSHWQTIVRGTGVFGTFEDKTFPAVPGTQGKPPRLVVTGDALFGSVIVKN